MADYVDGVNMTGKAPPAGRRYHHGDLARALLSVAVELAEAGGPDAVVLREAARRNQVSAAAAYRHFRGQRDLLAAVAHQALVQMGAAMLEAQGQVPAGLSPARRAELRWQATGEGYVRFAVAHPGLFRTTRAVPTAERQAGSGPLPAELLADALDECVSAGIMSPAQREGADALCWVVVHGLAELVLDGPLPGHGLAFEALLRRSLGLLAGLLDG